MTLSFRHPLGPLALALPLLLAGNAAQAGNAFGGASIGKSNYDYSSSQCTDDAAAAGLIGDCNTDSNSMGFRVYGGYNLNSYLGAELAFTDLSKLNLDVSGASGSIKSHALSLQLVATAPLDDKLSLFAAAGVYSADTTLSVLDPTFGVHASDSASGANYGVGARYAFSQAVSLRFEWQRFADIDFPEPASEGSADLIALGFQFNFK